MYLIPEACMPVMLLHRNLEATSSSWHYYYKLLAARSFLGRMEEIAHHLGCTKCS